MEAASKNVCRNPVGPAASYNPGHPFAAERVVKGGSFLCNPDYCESYLPSARRGTPPDTGSSHTGFRCVISVTPPKSLARSEANFLSLNTRPEQTQPPITNDWAYAPLVEQSLNDGEVVVQAGRSTKMVNMIQKFIHKAPLPFG
jgi:hypothetical protein